MKREETAQLISVLCAAFPNTNVPRETVEVYHEALKDLEVQATREAVRELLLTADWFPPAAAIRRRVAQKARILAPEAGEAWGEVCGAVRASGRDKRPTLSHPALDRAVGALGWRAICMSENTDTIRAHFLKTYEVERLRADNEMLSSPMLGQGDIKSLGEGHEAQRSIEA